MLSQFAESLRARLLTTSTLAQETSRDGQTLINNFFQSTVVDDTPAFVLANDFSRLLNFGEIVTNNAVAAVQAQGQDVDVFNFRSGRIEANSGPDALATGVQVTGSAAVRNFGEIAGEFNGVQFAGAESSGSLDNFRGAVISSDSRAVDIQGQGIDVRNFGDIVGTGDQRNGTIYTNATAEDISISNFTGGTIDAGEGNQGAGISLQIGDQAGDRVQTDVFNGFGATIQGRGQAAANTPLAGDGIRIDDGAEGTILETEIINSGLISTESNQGTAAGIRIADGANAEGEILNTSTGVIEGPRNGLYIGNGEHDLDVLNFGTIQSGSRAVNIDGSGVDLINGGDILGTGDQRNGTVYADDTARDFSINNLATGAIDAGEHNNGAGISLSLAEDGNGDIEIENAGVIAGRGNAGAALGTAGDGIRLEGVRQDSGFAPASFTGTITNSGSVTSEGGNGTVGAFRAVNNVNFQGRLINEETGVFAGGQNGVYFGTGDHSGGSFVNRGLVTSDSRALNIDGVGLEVLNEGQIIGTGNQRNGTVYADGTADNYAFTNTGLVDAGEGNNGSAVSLQTGDVSGDVVSAVVVNEGTLQGRGDAAEGNQVGDGLRLFTSQDDASFAGIVVNEGLIAGSEGSDAAAGIRVDGGLNLLGAILNKGEIRGTVNAIDASDAGTVTIVNDDEGVINGNVLLSDGDDIFVDLGTTNGDIDGGAGDDVLIAGDADNVLTSGLGNDFIDGGEGIDTADFSDLDVAVNVRLDANGNGTATRDTGFNVSITDSVVAAPDQFGANIPDGAWFVEEAVQGNLYYNIHTTDFPAGEIRGQLLVDSDVTENGIRTVSLSGGLDAAQEPGPTSDSLATGDATVVITQNLATGDVSYSSDLSVVGLNEADLNTPIPGVVSAIHLHNAPAGQNGPVVQDTLVDAGATLDVDAQGGTGVIGQDVIENQIETDILQSIENVVGSDDGDVIFGSDQTNVLNGADGDDLLNGEGGNDVLIGGAGADTFQFGANFGNDTIEDFEVGLDQLQFGDFGPDFGAQVNVAQDGGDAVISFGDEGSVRLVGINVADLNDNDFVA
ncbi:MULTISPECIES: S-layer family protein [unclassified Ruegeria]|uniref:beta strand repeat-containing protein n=1 Tax=unclassified Ruegeria TaxID=2625375 RepID=UPI001489464A|nr:MULTISPECIES: CHRD domain-containing protein [unclassified Ruegeria]NOD64502.1 CHRD domain-containing protein [Ruegeria sp. HKCCD6109]